MYEISQHNITRNIIKINIKLNCKTLDIILEWNYEEVGKLNWVGLITNMKTLHHQFLREFKLFNCPLV